MSSAYRVSLLAVLLVAVAAGFAPADPVSDQQKKVAVENLEKAEVRKAAVVETESLIVCAVLRRVSSSICSDASSRSSGLIWVDGSCCSASSSCANSI